MGFAKIKGNLTSRQGRRVKFGAPQDVQAKEGGAARGTVVDDVWADETLNSSPMHKNPCDRGIHCWGDYSFFSQLIEWDEPSTDGKHSIRLGYWRRRCGEDHWEFAGQMTVTSDCDSVRTLM